MNRTKSGEPDQSSKCYLSFFPLESESDIISSASESASAGSSEHLSASEGVFLDLFQSRYDSSVQLNGSDSWRPMSRWHYLTDKELLDSIFHRSNIKRAVQLDSTKRYSAFELSAEDNGVLARFLSTMHSSGVKKVDIYRLSAQSNILHCYIFWNTTVEQQNEQLLTQILEQSQLSSQVRLIKQSLVLPLQRGFARLRQDGQTDDAWAQLTLDEALNSFIDSLLNQPSDWLNVSALFFKTPENDGISAIDASGYKAFDGTAMDEDVVKATSVVITAHSTDEMPFTDLVGTPGELEDIANLDSEIANKAVLVALDMRSAELGFVDSIFDGLKYADNKVEIDLRSLLNPKLEHPKFIKKKTGASVARASPVAKQPKQLTLSLTSKPKRDKSVSKV